jgi:hypothetical protein
MGLVGRFLKSMLARLHSGCGWAALRLGWRSMARRHYERVLVLRGSDFTAYVQLGRLAFAAGDYASWRREFEHARRADPERFARLRHPFELFEPRLAGTDFDETGDRATWRSLLPFGGSSSRRPTAPRIDAPLDGGFEALLPGWDVRADATTDAVAPRPTDGAAADGRTAPHDDCLSAAERRRLSALGPIRAVDVRSCDLDELVRRLSG